MSDRLSANDVLFLQRLLSCCGHYSDTLDGAYGKNTSDAEAKFDAKCHVIAQSEGVLSFMRDTLEQNKERRANLLAMQAGYSPYSLNPSRHRCRS